LRQAAEAKKCWACGCLHGSLATIEQVYSRDQRPAALNDVIRTLHERVKPVEYDCRGCDPCFPPEAMNALGIEAQACPAEVPQEREGWPPLAGDYTILRYQAPVAICTLTDGNLAGAVAKDAGPETSIVGTMQTENLGIERIIQNTIANPNIRHLILCGPDSRQAIGHLPGQSLLALAANGLDGQGRIIGARGRRPYVRNVGPQGVEHFRRNVEVINMVGNSDLEGILEQARRCAARNPGPAEPFFQDRRVAVIAGHVPPKMTPDPAGYFVIYADHRRGLLSMEHYSNEGVLDAVIEGRNAAEVYMEAIGKALVSRLDHAAYLGKELARAERSLVSGEPYVQDAAPEQTKEVCADGSCHCSAQSRKNGSNCG
jgi:tetrahydromethanopterin S-methyltransferase subunit A